MNRKARTIKIHPAPTANAGRRRFFRDVVALSGASLVLPNASASQDYSEEGDPKCRADFKPTPPAYPLTGQLLTDFIALSEAITGFSTLDRSLAADYLRRFASHPRTSLVLPAMIRAFQDIAPHQQPISDHVLRAKLLKDDALKFGTQQLVYLWYLSALAIPNEKGELVWIYDEVEQFENGLLWKSVHAHAPMVTGGPHKYWKNKPQSA